MKTMSRKFFKSFIVSFQLVLLIGFSTGAEANQCLKLLLKKTSSTQRSLETLIEKMEGLGIKLELREEVDLYGSAADDYFEIVAYNRMNEPVGEVTMVPMGQSLVFRAEEKSLYASHIDIYENGGSSMRGVGLGTYLYTAAAWSIHKLGGVLFSSTGPSSQAIDAWERMVDAGWATRGTERDDELSQVNSPITSLSSYRFNQDLLESDFFDDLDEVIEDRDMLFIREY